MKSSFKIAFLATTIVWFILEIIGFVFMFWGIHLAYPVSPLLYFVFINTFNLYFIFFSFAAIFSFAENALNKKINFVKALYFISLIFSTTKLISIIRYFYIFKTTINEIVANVAELTICIVLCLLAVYKLFDFKKFKIFNITLFVFGISMYTTPYAIALFEIKYYSILKVLTIMILKSLLCAICTVRLMLLNNDKMPSNISDQLKKP